MNPRENELFQRFPLNGAAQISTGSVSTPYQIYRGYGAFIGGTASLDAVRHMLKDEDVEPAQNLNRRALMGVWVCDFVDANLGPHHELQVSIFVSQSSRNPVVDISAHRLGLLTAMLTRPDLHMMCHGLWNNTSAVVAYNRELLSLNARLSSSVITRSADELAFSVKDAGTGDLVCAGDLSAPTRASMRATWDFAAQLGFREAMRINQRPWVSMNIVNPLGVGLAHNAVAQAHTKNDVNKVRYFDPLADSITFGANAYRELDFVPQFVQHMDGFKFVYLNPLVPA